MPDPTEDERPESDNVEDVLMHDMDIEVDSLDLVVDMPVQLDNVLDEESLNPKSKLCRNLLNFQKIIDFPIEVEINTDVDLTSTQEKSLEFYNMLSANNVPKNAKGEIIRVINDYIGENCSGT